MTTRDLKRQGAAIFFPQSVLLLLLAGCSAESTCHGDCDGEGEADGSADDHGSESSGGEASLADQWCQCMLANCHFVYHEQWGEDHLEAEAACAAVADTVPSAGMDVDAGDFLECRLHFCETAMSTEYMDDPQGCPPANGGGACR